MKKMKKLAINQNNKKYYSNEYIKGWEDGVKAQYEATIDVETVPGEWIGLDECSVCGKQAYDFIEGCIEGVEYLPNFCPNCGTKMK